MIKRVLLLYIGAAVLLLPALARAQVSPPLKTTKGATTCNPTYTLAFASGTLSCSGSVATYDPGAGAGTVTSVTCGTGLSCSAANPIVASGTIAVNYGTTSTTACAGNDARLPPTPSTVGKMLYDTGTAYAATAAGTNGQLPIGSSGAAPVMASLTAGSGITLTPGAGSLSIAASPSGTAVYGDGSDGTAVFDGSGAVTGATRSGSTYTLTRDVYYTSATLSAGVTVEEAGFALFATGTLTIPATATIRHNGGTAVDFNAGTAAASGSAAGSVIGGAGGGGAGVAGTSTQYTFGGGGGAGGVGSAGASGAGGSATAPLASYGGGRTIESAMTAHVSGFGLLGLSYLTGGAGGGGGGGNGGTNGGGGGGGGGIVRVLAKTIVLGGSIQANGGGGASGVNSGEAGGGGGGGGTVWVVYSSKTGVGTITASGGAAGSGVGVGTSGVAGSAGTVIQIVN